ncbi:NQR2/RnfD/RnfE family subunit of NADH-ubiquinone oxidoreductase [Nonomuraea polychroma]|uniref:NQR2/RnfD/RnfE family subunit of NADH-ubiquinone oxidoreductase n=1 Tax=Nonomuraea polychroma TaxID=46176 RepID=A0A438M2R6_9ACTN|nr:RnfABCDGE type electron transport complex subunit D [Nonomuraea polychroma]RVX39778.1 NQR2/RnfD/RnfE family subunit of NADH-ubiquinone oxidoreductase [Nonomuraea polychroma]
MTESPAPRDKRVAALRRFAVSITVLTVVGHAALGFEQAFITPVAAVICAYVLELGLEVIDARTRQRPMKFQPTWRSMIDFLLPAHITGLACAMLLYANDRVEPILLAVTIAIASKYLVQVPVGGRLRHVLNPSNTGIVVVLLLFPWVGIAPPYHFTEWVSGPVDWLIPAGILMAGTMLNAKLTGKMPLILGWLAGFVAQAVIRSGIEGTPVLSALLVMSGTAFILFTNYMITDPGTTPVRPRNQVWFGVITAGVYGTLVAFHIVFGLFFALTIVCALRGVGLALLAWLAGAPRPQVEPEPELALVGASRVEGERA